MPYTKEQLRVYWQANKAVLNQKRRQKRKLAKLALKACHQCQASNLPLAQAWNDKYYCLDCLNWNQAAEQSGINTCYRYTSISCGETCRSCCPTCQARQSLINYSSSVLMEAVLNRPEFKAITSWEDDSFLRRFQEIIWELRESEGMTPSQIQAAVTQDILRKPSQRKKYSRGV